MVCKPNPADRWSRSSRTDKGVSSLATVVSLRMELDPAAWDEDVEGGSVAASLNQHMPSDVRVFGAYSVPKGFQARRVCTQRTYDYLLPARVLGLGGGGDGDGNNVDGKTNVAVQWPGTAAAAGRSDEEVLASFRDALRAFEGSHPFHNYTRRSYYSPSTSNGRGEDGKKKKWKGAKSGGGDDDAAGGSTEEEELEVNEEEEEAKERASVFSERREEEEEDERVGYTGPDYIGTRRHSYYWLMGKDDNDLIGIKHSRKVNSFVAGDVETAHVASGGGGGGDTTTTMTEPFIRVTAGLQNLN